MVFQSGCVPYNPQSPEPYGYKPFLTVAIAFLVPLAGSLGFHLYRAVKLRRFTSIFFSAAACAECVGWSGRIMASSCPYRQKTFTIQMLAFIIAPSLILIGSFLTLRLFMLHTAHHPKNLSPNVCFSLLALLLAASTALRLSGATQTILDLTPAGPIGMGPILLIGGYVLQVFIIFTMFFFLLFHSPDKAQLNFGFQIGQLPIAIAIAISILSLLIHSGYHIAANIQGWRGSLFTHQEYFIGFDAVTMFVAVVVYNIFDPAVMLGPTYHHMSNDETGDFGGRLAPVVMHRGTPFEIVRQELAG